MKDEMKKYEKPSIEVIDIQWSECIAIGSTPQESTGRIVIKVDPAANNNSFFWLEDSNSGWDSKKF